MRGPVRGDWRPRLCELAYLDQAKQEAKVKARALDKVELLAADAEEDGAEDAAVLLDNAPHQATQIHHLQHVLLQHGEQVRDVGLRVITEELQHLRAHVRREHGPHFWRLFRRDLVRDCRHGGLHTARVWGAGGEGGVGCGVLGVWRRGASSDVSHTRDSAPPIRESRVTRRAWQLRAERATRASAGAAHVQATSCRRRHDS